MNAKNLTPLTIDEFDIYFKALYSKVPFAWQKRLAKQVCESGWPACIKLPTASGKTAAIDIAVFSLAYQASLSNRPEGEMTAPRRIFFVVDRRIIVNEAYRRATLAADKLRWALSPDSHAVTQRLSNDSSEELTILIKVAKWLQRLAGDETAPPLDCFELRGGIYRNDAWVRSLLQPTVITSTVDQVGSRLLFRGYGVADNSLSVHAALTANDSLIILDEAHCSKPFSQTLDAVANYRSDKWRRTPSQLPFNYVQMSATPPVDIANRELFQLSDEDYRVDQTLEKRHVCKKPVKLLRVEGAKAGKLGKLLVTKLVEQATDLAEEKKCHKIAVIVNRVDIARLCYAELLLKHPGRVHLMIGRMRPIDRDALTEMLQKKFGSNASTDTSEASLDTQPHFVVATQCLEVGADLDFDGMVSQCASLDALRQRFGRLNRLGESQNACGVIVAPEEDIPPVEKLDPAKPLDRVYGNSLAKTWSWLNELSTNQTQHDTEFPLDFGIRSLDAVIPIGELLQELLAPAPDAAVLMPAHVDMLCQTSPRPKPEPDIASYLHGPHRGVPEVRVCWRADLELDLEVDSISRRVSDDPWYRAVELCPPSTAECLTVPLYLFIKWLRGETANDSSSDVLGEVTDSFDEEKQKSVKQGIANAAAHRSVLVWRGELPAVDGAGGTFKADASSARAIRRNDTIVIPVEFGGWECLGHIPNAPAELFRSPIEVYKALMKQGDDTTFAEQVAALSRIDVADEAFFRSRARTIYRFHPKLSLEPALQKFSKSLFEQSADENADLAIVEWQRRLGEILNKDELSAKGIRLCRWDGNPVKGSLCRYPGGIAWITERHSSLTRSPILPLPSFGDDANDLQQTERISLIQHLSDVFQEAKLIIDVLSIKGPIAESILSAAKFHDLGKADPRFQAMLINKPLNIAYMQPILWAKSDQFGGGGRRILPKGFRHEMRSLQLIDSFEFGREHVNKDLTKHLIASHHGFARPFAPSCIDENCELVNLASLGAGEVTSAQQQGGAQAHRIDSGVAERFWSLNREFGWWGLALLEATVRLADWKASGFPKKATELLTFSTSSPNSVDVNPNLEPKKGLTLSGLDGSNPLAFLAALGAFRTLSLNAPNDMFQLSWSVVQGAWRPILYSNRSRDLTDEEVLDLLETILSSPLTEHPTVRLNGMLEENDLRDCFQHVANSANSELREDAEWLSCNGSDVSDPSLISQLQTTRRDYHVTNIKGLVENSNRERIRRSLFLNWDYSDPIAGVSLHLEPREDRRHAYQWHTPSGDPTRQVSGGMIGANRLALEAWPLFQSLPDGGEFARGGEKLVTVGFRGTRANNTRFFWPIWSKPIGIETLRSLLSLSMLDTTKPDEQVKLQSMGIEAVYQCKRILVGKTPNLTSPEPVFVASSM